ERRHPTVSYVSFVFVKAEDAIRVFCRPRGPGNVYKSQADDKAALTLGDTGAVVADRDLPRTGTAGGSLIGWASGDPAVVSDTGLSRIYI
ncbi:immunoglobulin-like domain-containing protein, partial [Clavibacter michiganensis]|uniref:immunoglobulin-like domain-containing protein n=1 Tax=Clavibacter michiganensis TaxID=28447 RepID=UPI00292EFF8D